MIEQTAARRRHPCVRPRRYSPTTFTLTDDEFVHKGPAIVGRQTPSVLTLAKTALDGPRQARLNPKEFR